MSKKTILLAEDDQDIQQVLKLYLSKEYEVMQAYDGVMALEMLEQNDVALAVVDLMMPKMDGMELIRTLRRTYCIPVIILSARSSEQDKIEGLEIGADDYLTKPFGPAELLARIRAQLRRAETLNAQKPVSSMKVGDLEVDCISHAVTLRGEQILITAWEYHLLCCLMKHPGKVYTKKQIIEAVTGSYLESDANSLMVHISNLRDKIERDPKKPEYLITVRGLGYRFAREDELCRNS